MFSQYFGNYLLNKGLITSEQLKEALDIQRSVHVKIGAMAVNACYMTAAQSDAVHNKQKKVDKIFGELAIESGFITEKQLNELLAAQRQNHIMLGQILTDKHYLTPDQLKKALDDYKTDYRLTERQFNMIQQDNTDEIVNAFFNFGETLWSKVYGQYISLMLKNIIRFIDDNPRVEIRQAGGEYRNDWFIYQEVTGKINIMMGIACDDSTLVEFAGRFTGEKYSKTDEIVQNSVCEFLNLNNNIFLVNMSNNGIELNTGSCYIYMDHKIRGLKKAYIISCHLSCGKADMVMI